MKISAGTLAAAAIADRAFSLNLLETNQPDLNYDLIREMNYERHLALGIEGDLISQRVDQQGGSWCTRRQKIAQVIRILIGRDVKRTVRR